MKAILKLENIGQKVGLQTLEFNSGVVTLIQGRTASGKSRIIKSYALALSYPIKSDNLINDGINFGILKGEDAEYLPLVNASQEKATIELEYDEISKKVELFKDGKININILGNQKFLYSSMLVKNSRIHNHITTGKASFRWIVDEMSLAKDYEKIKANVLYNLDELTKEQEEDQPYNPKKTSKRGEIKQKKLIQKAKSVEKKKEVSDRVILEASQKEKQKQIDDFQFDEELVKKEKDTERKLTADEKNLKDITGNLEKIQRKIEELEKQKNDTSEIDKIHSKMDKNEQRLTDLKTDKVEDLQKEIIEKQNLRSVEEQEKVRFETRKQLWETVKIEEGNKCPLCESVGIITPEHRKSKINEYNKEIKEHQILIKDYTTEINKKLNRINEINTEIPALEKQQFIDGDKIKELEQATKASVDEIALLKKKVPNIKKQILNDEELIKKTKQELKLILEEKDKNSEYQKLKNESRRIDKDIGMIKERLIKIEDALEEAKSIELFSIKITDLNKAEQIINELEKIIHKSVIYLDNKIDEHRKGAAKKFNESIKNLIMELKFDTFKEIYLNLDDYQLKIIDNNEKLQELSSVSGGEKAIISSLLQISAKETYLSEIPFLIGDEIILDLDPERRDIFLNYLKKIAKENDWFIILTQITNEDLEIIEI